MNLSQLSQIAQLKGHLNRFQANHPKFPRFMEAVYRNALSEGTVIEINVTTPEGKNYVTNLKITRDDIDALRAVESMKDMNLNM